LIEFKVSMRNLVRVSAWQESITTVQARASNVYYLSWRDRLEQWFRWPGPVGSPASVAYRIMPVRYDGEFRIPWGSGIGACTVRVAKPIAIFSLLHQNGVVALVFKPGPYQYACIF